MCFIVYYDVVQALQLETDKRELDRQVNELKARCDQVEKKAIEQRAVEEKKHIEEVSFLKRTNQQLKVPPAVYLQTHYFR